jgi:NADH-quinone oxidoreductase subunit F
LGLAESFRNIIDKKGLSDKVDLKVTGCLGFCEQAPAVMAMHDEVLYCKVTPDDVEELLEAIIAGKVVDRLVYADPVTGRIIPRARDIPFYSRQTRMLLEANWHTNPVDICDYIARGGYHALSRVLAGMNPEEVIAMMKEACLRGRGGAGFPTWLKWDIARKQLEKERYMICNADEGDPGAFMDRSILEGNPHALLEGMLIAGFAIGSSNGIIYVRAEYPTAVAKIQHAIQQCQDLGLVGKDILGSGFDFDLTISKGAGAFVCGEETALIRAAEGGVAEPRQKPPYPSESGFKGKPTVINNVETLANVPIIVERGAGAYRSLGTEKSGGTKIFCLVGKVLNAGLIEVSFGTRLGDVIFDIGGGTKKGKRFKAVQTGGPSGGCLPADKLNLHIDFEELALAGSIIGSGGMIIMDEDTCIVDVTRYFLGFLKSESCGKCFSCRVGIERMLEIVDRIAQGRAVESDLDLLEELALTVKDTSLCGLGQTAPNPVLSSLRYFREEYLEHIRHKFCRATVCESLFRSPCQNSCPAGVDVPIYVDQIRHGEFIEAYETVQKNNPFPVVCGRVCHHPCESRCRREQIDKPVAIRALKRFAADYAVSNGQRPARVPGIKSSKKVAVIGAGPAGLTAAFYLGRKGHQVTVFESSPVPGGMLALGIPDYRLPKDSLNADIEAIRNSGVKMRMNSALGRDFTLQDLREDGYEAIFLAIGAHKDRDMGIPGEGLEGVLSSVEFLRAVNLGHQVDVDGKAVAVVGGGNAAIDAARVALRKGARVVHILYRRRQEDMPAMKEEIADALAEGIHLTQLTAPVRILGDDKVRAIECVRMGLGDFDETGRRRPVAEAGMEFHLPVDVVIRAIGQAPDVPDTVRKTVSIAGNGTIAVDSRSLSTQVAGVFAGGDCVTGPAMAIDAIAQGRIAAASIDKYLGGDGVLWGDDEERVRQFRSEIIQTPLDRYPPGKIPLSERIRSFREVEMAYSEEVACNEASRCLRCDVRQDDEEEQDNRHSLAGAS